MTTPTLDALDIPSLTSATAARTSRRMIDRVLTAGGLLMTAVLVFAGGLLIWARTFVASQVPISSPTNRSTSTRP
jgi:hypothetical protein